MMIDSIEVWWVLILVGWFIGIVMGLGAGWMARIVYLDWWWPRKIKKMYPGKQELPSQMPELNL